MERRALAQAIGVLMGVAALGGGVVARLEHTEVESRRRAAADLARGSARALERELDGALASAATLAALVSHGAGEAQLDAVARRLLELRGAVSNLQLARDCVISHLWPLAGNEAAYGLDLAASPRHGRFVRQVLASGRPLLYGPFELVQGGVGLALRVPVAAPGAEGQRPWGLSSAVIRLPSLLEAARLARLGEAGLDWDLARPAQGDLTAQPLAASGPEAAALQAPEAIPVELPGQAWTLAVAPRGGWVAGPTRAARIGAVALLALLAAGLAYHLLAQPAVLRREVAARTAELTQAHLEQARVVEAQRQSQKLEAIGLLAGGVAHDFNNLLVGILGYADLLSAEARPGSLQEDAARTIGSAAQRAAELTRQLLAFARLGHQRREEVDVHALVREVAGLLQRTLDKSIRVALALEAPLHHVLGDAGQLQQVILNLAVNARDAMPEGGTLTLDTSVVALEEGSPDRGLAPGTFLVVSVTDTGAGIPAALQERIFEPFFTTKPEGKGTGLGLATVYGIAKGHGGTVRVYSEEGAGARFLVYLPVHAEPAQVRAVEAAAPRGSGTVLVVDDEELVRRTAGRLLASLGYQPVLVPGGFEAIAWLREQAEAPAAVLLDLAMPGMDGRACFRQLRLRFPRLRVVVSSGFARNGRAQELLDEGACGFVQKPYRTGELARALAEAIAPPQP